MLKRDFDRVSIDYGTARRPAYQISCSKCGKKDEVVSGKSAQIHPDILRKRFGERGWSVSQASASKDICPDCLLRGKLALHPATQPPEEEMPKPCIICNRPDKEEIEAAIRQGVQQHVIGSHYGMSQTAVGNHYRNHMKPFKAEEIKPVKYAPNPPEKLTASHILPEPPQEPTRDDKKLINMKLTEVYLENSYANGWTDKRVSEDLGVPQAWVATIREEFFGPENSNDEAAQFVQAVKELDEKLTLWQTGWDAVHKGIVSMVDDHNKYGDSLLKMREELTLLTKLTKHIEKQFRG
jgi:hypothetical protein